MFAAQVPSSLIEYFVFIASELVRAGQETPGLRAVGAMPSWFSVSVAQVGFGIGVGVAAVVEAKVIATTKCGAITGSIVVDAVLLIPVLQHLELPVQLVFQGEQESPAAVSVATSC